MTIELPTYHCHKIQVPLSIDGNLEKTVWPRIQPVEFILSDGSGAPQRQTELRLCWDNDFLYLAFHCLDPDIWGTYQKHDDPIYEEEVVEAFLCPSGDLTTYYEFELSPRNVKFDALLHNPAQERSQLSIDTSWDCHGWQTAVIVEGTLDNRTDVDSSWNAEMAIPFAQLLGPPNIPPKPGDVWGANFYRIDRTPQPEFTCWSPTLRTPPDFHLPSHFGRLIFEQ